MGRTHALMVRDGRIPGLRLAAVADPNGATRRQFSGLAVHGDGCALIRSAAVDAVLIATPHYSHVPLALAALRAGLHVLVEKPIAAQTSQARRLARAARAHPRQVCAAMFNQRTDPLHLRLRRLLKSSALGPVTRVQWTITDWYRTAAYYRESPWRATWAGEGGGVLVNQCAHHLDLFQWLFGQPAIVRAHCAFGRHHDIEVEDEVHAFMEFADGSHATLVTSTGEAPGVNRLEVAADGGLVIVEKDSLRLCRNRAPTAAFTRASRDYFARPPVRESIWTRPGPGPQHAGILRNFAAAIQGRAPLIAPLAEGAASVELANAILLSAWTGKSVRLPLVAARYDAALARKIAASRR